MPRVGSVVGEEEIGAYSSPGWMTFTHICSALDTFCFFKYVTNGPNGMYSSHHQAFFSLPRVMTGFQASASYRFLSVLYRLR